MDFFQITTRERKGGVLEAYPDFVVGRSEDLMVRGNKFYAVWDEDAGLWSTDDYAIQPMVDARLKSFLDENPHIGGVKYMRNFSSNGQTTWRKFLSQIGDNSHQLDNVLTFKSTPVVKKDYVSKRLPYDLAPGDISAWNQLVGTLYKPEERAKIEWSIGSIITGDSRTNQKFLVLYGPPGAGKGTIIDILMKLFQGYVTTFDAKALGSNGNQFAAAAFASNPLLAIQHDGDLSRIEDNTLLNSIVSHEVLKVNEKYKAAYDARIMAFLVMGTNKPVKITDAQSGLIRRLIDAHPSGVRLPPSEYHRLVAQIDFELGAIAEHCVKVYKAMGKHYYSNYRPVEMMFKTNPFHNFIDAHFDIFEEQNGTSTKQAWNLYQEYCKQALIDRPLKMYQFKDELGHYFKTYHERFIIDGTPIRSYHEGFLAEPFKTPVDDDVKKFTLVLDETVSLLDLVLAEYPAQYSNANGAPKQRWVNVKTTLAEINTAEEHYVRGFPETLIVADFDIRDENGEKSLELNLEAAALWPATYAELSKSGQGVHLHYWYQGDPSLLDPNYAPGIEVKVFAGNSALRRRLTKCNSVPIADISTGLPFKEHKRVLDPGTMKSEKGLRALISRNLKKEIHPGTKPSIDFIKHILDEAYEDGLVFDVSDMYPSVIAFANNSTHNALECLKIVQSMRWKSEEEIADKPPVIKDKRLVFFDCEVYPNLFVLCWKFAEEPGVEPKAENVVRMVNPKAHEVEALFDLKLVGFNNRAYDNHILWAAAMGFSNIQLYHLSQKIISNASGAKFGEAYRLSWTDIYDYASEKKSLKKWQVGLGLQHREMDLPWDEPVKQEDILRVVEYCVNDVTSTESVHNHRIGDYTARLILADLAELSPNDTTAKLTAAIVFGKDYARTNPQRNFVYTQLSKEFPGYVYESGKSTYRDETVGEGGYVYAEPGLYRDVALLDVASMHPTSIGQLNLFGEYTSRFMALVDAQLAIKHGDYASTKSMLAGKLVPYIEEIERLQSTDAAAAKKAAGDLRYGLKIAINIVYGLTSAKFDNPFKDNRNVDNIVAKRGALFMIDLKRFVQDRGFTVAHIKTDSIKIPNATPEIIEAVQNFAMKYGYNMEHEATYAKLGLVNDAVYIAKKDDCISNCWSATGAQFQRPYVFKTLFGYTDDINFHDLCETRTVQQGALHLDFGAYDAVTRRPDETFEEGFVRKVDGTNDQEYGYIERAVMLEKHAEKQRKSAEKNNDIVRTHEAEQSSLNAKEAYEHALKSLIHVGKVGRFTPVLPGYGGGQLWRIKDGKHYAVTGTKGRLWVDSTVGMGLPDDAIDYDYFDTLVNAAREDLRGFLEQSTFGSVEEFLS